MNALWITPEEIESCRRLDGKTLKITDPFRLQHLTEILDVKSQQSLNLCLINHGMANATIVSINDSRIELSLLLPVDEIKNDYQPIERAAFLGLSRPQTIKKILEYGTTMGVTNFYFVPAQLSEKSYATAKIWQPSQYTHHLHLGLSQSNYYFRMPKVEILNSWKQIPARLTNISQRYICSWKSSLINHNAEIPFAMAIGPERGWTEQEEELWRQMAFIDLSLGASVLRVECALVSALTKLN